MSRAVLAYKMVKVIDQTKSAVRARNIMSHAQAQGHTFRSVAERMGISAGHLCRLTQGSKPWSHELEHAFLAATEEPQ